MRRGKTDRVPKTRASGQWTEAAFWGFIRSGIRQMSSRWPPMSEVLREFRREYNGPNGRQKWEYQCALCGDWFPQAVTVGGKKKAVIQVDHIDECGTLSCFEDISGFCKRLFCEKEGLRVVCKDCHQKRTKESRDEKRVKGGAIDSAAGDGRRDA